jgi:hypothetical protein
MAASRYRRAWVEAFGTIVQMALKTGTVAMATQDGKVKAPQKRSRALVAAPHQKRTRVTQRVNGHNGAAPRRGARQ